VIVAVKYITTPTNILFQASKRMMVEPGIAKNAMKII
jgi:hypothetical protein